VADSSDDDSSDEDSSDDDNDSSSAGSDGAVGDGDVKPVSAAAPMAAATYSSSSASGSSSPAKKKAKAKKQQKPCSLLERFITEHHDPSSHVLGFLGGTALKGIGATARGLRKTVKNLLPTASFSQNDSSTLPSLAAFPRLLQLALDCRYCQRSKQWASDLLLLDWNKRLESLAIWGKDPGFATALVAQPWPKLQALEIYPLEPLLDVMAGRPAVVFPNLQSLAVGSLNGTTARGL
jgi:hypothetical protein